jgi:putative ABC transport system permease protein
MEAEKYIYQVDITHGTNCETLAGRLRDKLGAGYSIESMDSFLEQTLGGVTGRIGKSVYMILVIGIVITVLMVLLYMELRLTRNAPALAEKIMMGIDFTSIRLQEMYPMLIPALLGCLTGTLVTELLGEGIVSGLFSLLGLGMSSISFAQMSVLSLLIPAGLLIALAVTTMASCMKISRMDVVEFFNK